MIEFKRVNLMIKYNEWRGMSRRIYLFIAFYLPILKDVNVIHFEYFHLTSGSVQNIKYTKSSCLYHSELYYRLKLKIFFSSLTNNIIKEKPL
jgi:hypothetical protein